MKIKETQSLILPCSTLFNPAKFIGAGWKVDEQDERSLSLLEVDFDEVRFEACLNPGEDRISGEEKLKRLKAMPVISLGSNHLLALWNDYKARGQDSVLEWLRQNRKLTYLDFFGFILRGPSGYRSVLCLCWGGGEWFWSYDWLVCGWKASYLSAVLGSQA